MVLPNMLDPNRPSETQLKRPDSRVIAWQWYDWESGIESVA